jgi:hypothetical protein
VWQEGLGGGSPPAQGNGPDNQVTDYRLTVNTEPATQFGQGRTSPVEGDQFVHLIRR